MSDTTPASWRPEVNTAGDPEGVFTSNALRFRTEAEAFTWAGDLALRWTAVADFRAAPSTDAPTHRLGEGGRAIALTADDPGTPEPARVDISF
jgi:hypothetical protein